MSSDQPLNVTDQRYYHAAALIPRTPGFGIAALRKLLAAEFRTSKGRLALPEADDPRQKVEAFCIHASAAFAGSDDARLAMAVPRTDKCAYDAFAMEIALKEPLRVTPGGARALLIIGTSYAGVTRHVFGRLAEGSSLMERTLFAVPDLDGIVALCRRRNGSTDATLTLTGVSTLRAGGKYVRGLRISGRDVLAGGIIEVIEEWCRAAEDGLPEKEKAKEKPFTLHNIRIRGELRHGTEAATLTMARDGSTKMWMRSRGSSVLPFMRSLWTVSQMHLFEASAERPKWAEEREF
jgi:hypothetical protein